MKLPTPNKRIAIAFENPENHSIEVDLSGADVLEELQGYVSQGFWDVVVFEGQNRVQLRFNRTYDFDELVAFVNGLNGGDTEA